MDKTTKRWVVIVLGIFLAIGVFGLAAIGTTIYYVSSHIESETVSDTVAEDRFARELERFKRTQPLIDIRGRDDVVVNRPAESAQVRTIRSIRVLAYDERREAITDVTIPFSIVRWMPSGRFSARSAGADIDWDRSNVTIEDLERFGPGLILDHQERGQRVLVWSE